MARSRAWETSHEEQADISTADNKALGNAGSIFSHSTVEDLAGDVGGNRELAILMLKEQGKEATKTSINSQMRSIQRWQKRERGETGGTKPKAPAQDILKRITVDQKLASGKKIQARVKGPSSVNGYKRGNRDAEIYLDPDEARELFEAMREGDMDAAWDMLAGAYGVSEFHAYGGASIEFN
jgi:hypothetical protein